MTICQGIMLKWELLKRQSRGLRSDMPRNSKNCLCKDALSIFKHRYAWNMLGMHCWVRLVFALQDFVWRAATSIVCLRRVGPQVQRFVVSHEYNRQCNKRSNRQCKQCNKRNIIVLSTSMIFNVLQWSLEASHRSQIKSTYFSYSLCVFKSHSGTPYVHIINICI